MSEGMPTPSFAAEVLAELVHDGDMKAEALAKTVVAYWEDQQDAVVSAGDVERKVKESGAGAVEWAEFAEAARGFMEGAKFAVVAAEALAILQGDGFFDAPTVEMNRAALVVLKDLGEL